MECEKERIFKIHIAVDVKTKEILSMKITDEEHVHDIKALPELVENIIKSGSMATAIAIGKLFAYGVYEGKRFLEILEIINDKYSCIHHMMKSENLIKIFKGMQQNTPHL